MFVLTAWWSAWFGCSPDEAPSDETEPTGDTGPVTLPPQGDDEGSLVVLAWQASVEDPAPRTLMYGIFAESREGVVNLAQCVGSKDGFCAPALPAKPGESVVVTPLDPLLLDTLDTRYVGDEIRLGPWSAPYKSDPIQYYYSPPPGAPLPSEPVALTLDAGDWPEHDGEPVIPIPSAIEVTAPDPTKPVDLYDGSPLDLRWTPGGEGQVYLMVATPKEDRLFLLEDDGQEPLDLSQLNLNDGAAVTLILGRWTVTGVDIQGHDLNLQIQSNQLMRGVWHDTGPRIELTDLYAECAAAQGAAGVLPGSYTGEISGAGRDLDPGTGGCTGFQAGGPDALVPVDLLPEQLLTVRYELVADDASLYLLTDCNDVGSCLVGSDRNQNGVEEVVHLNDTGAPQRVYIVLDAFANVSDRFNLDIEVVTLGGDVLMPTCIEAMDQGPVGSGTYRGSLAVHANLVDPECAAPAGGGEGILQVYLEPGGSVRATASSPGADPKIYLMYHCAIGDSCFYAEDDESGDREELRYTNTTGVAEYFYLVVDSETNLGDYELDLTVQ